MAGLSVEKKRSWLEAFSGVEERILGDLGREIATIFVGDRLVKFSVDKALLSIKSPFFRQAFYGQFKEARTSELRIEEGVDEYVFETFVHWSMLDCLYQSSFDDKFEAIHLLKVFIFAERYLIEDLVEDSFQALVQYINKRKPDDDEKEFLKEAWEVAGRSKIRILVVFAAYFSGNMRPEVFDELLQEEPAFAVEFGRCMMFSRRVMYNNSRRDFYVFMVSGSAQRFLTEVSKMEEPANWKMP